MSPQSVPVPRMLRRCGSVSCLGLLAAILAAGCAARGLPTTSPPTVAPASPTTTAAVITPLPAITPVPAVSPAPPATTTPASEIAGPPAAALTPVGADAVAGQLGSFLWQGAGSDAPWLVPPAAQAVRDPGPYVVTFAPSLRVDSWTARWAPIVGGQAGDVAGFGDGGPGAIVLQGPDGPGTWSLQVDARFAGGSDGAYYWRLETAP